MHAQFLALSIGTLLLGVVILYLAITRLVGLLRNSTVARLPAVAQQSVGFEGPGTLVLYVEHPRFATALAQAAFSLRDAASGQEVRSWPVLFRTTSSGFATVRLSVRAFGVERAGQYVISIAGIRPGSDTSKDALIFMRPYGGAMILLILGILIGAFCFIGGLVFTALQLAGQ